MDSPRSHLGSPGGPLNPITPDRANRESTFMASLRSDLRSSPVHDKISQFNTLAMQSKSLERKTADAALKRAMLGREEAEGEMRRYRDETKVLRVQLEKARDREMRVSERLEAEQHGRAKETYAHTKAAWEKEIKHARKKTFKNDAAIIKLQEELKAARDGWRSVSDHLDNEKARSKAREQEAFAARYQMVSLEEKLGEALERIKVLEQERDAMRMERDTFRDLAKEEEVARIAAEGRIPLPKNEDHDDEFASPRKKKPRVSLSTADVVSSAASEAEFEEMMRKMEWEHQRAERAYETIDFLKAECQLKACEGARSLKRKSMMSPRRILVAPQDVTGPAEMAIFGLTPKSASPTRPSSRDSESTFKKPERPAVRKRSQPRRSTIFNPEEGTFRTVSQEEAQVLAATEGAAMHIMEQDAEDSTDEQVVEEIDMQMEDLVDVAVQPEEQDTQIEEQLQVQVDDASEPASPVDAPSERRMYARTPSVEPPAFALLAQERMSLASLLNAPHGDAHTAPLPSIPTVPDEVGQAEEEEEEGDEQAEVREAEEREAPKVASPPRKRSPRSSTTSVATSYRTSTTTTTIPIYDETERPASRFARCRTPSGESHSSFDGAVTPRLKMVEGAGERRDLSAPQPQAKPTSMSKAAGRVRHAR
ncbi:putative transporter [Verticillium dahliae VDG2]|nr:putative transporter [Verticillium dahliae VDG2]